MDNRYTRDENLILDAVKSENNSGKFADDELFKKRYSGQSFEGNADVISIANQLVTKSALLKFQFTNRQWYVVNQKFPLQAVMSKQLSNEQAALQAGSQSTDATQKQLNNLKKSVLNEIQKRIESAISELSKNPELSSEEVMVRDTQSGNRGELILSMIREGTVKFRKTFETSDLINQSTMFSSRLGASETNIALLQEIYDAMCEQGRILKAQAGKADLFYLSTSNIDEDYTNWMHKSREELHRQSVSPKNEKDKMQLVKKLNQVDSILNAMSSIKNISSSPAQTESVKAKSQIFQANTETSNPALMNDITNYPPKLKNVSQQAANIEADDLPVDSHFNDMDARSVSQKIIEQMQYNASRNVLEDFFDKYFSASTPDERQHNYKSILGSIALMIRMADFDRKNLYDAARAFIKKTEKDLPELMQMEALMDIERSWEVFLQKKDETEYFKHFRPAGRYTGFRSKDVGDNSKK